MSRLRMGRRTEERDKYENSLGDGHDDYYGDRRELTPTRPRRKTGADRDRDRDRDQNPPNTEGDDGWVWGRYRNSGGGGAPLRDVEGNQVANLRLVHHDAIQLQQSPTNSPKKSLRHGGDYDYDNGGGRHSHYERGPSSNRSDGYDDYGGIPGLTDRNHPNYSGGGNPSPKKFMSSLREITTNMTQDEIDARNRKEYAYKAQLKKQVDEKKKVKFAEKRKAEELKRRELEEYYRSYYRGNIPPEKMRELRKPIVVEGEEEFYSELREEEKKNAATRRGGGGGSVIGGVGLERVREQYAPPPLRIPRDDYNDDYDVPSPKNRVGGRGKVSPPSHRRTYDDYDDDYGGGYGSDRDRGGGGGGYDRERGRDHYDSPPRRTRETPPRNESSVRRGGGSSGDRGKPDRGSDWIRKEEYDELSLLCNKLLAQQEELEEEIQDKDAVIMTLKKASSSKGGLSKAGKEAIGGKAPQRSQSVHNMIKPEGRVRGAANAGAKPKSASAFGRKAPDPPISRREKQPIVAKEPKSFVEMSAAGLNRMPKAGRKALPGSKLTAKQDKLPSGGARQGRDGVSKLQLGIKGNQAPKIVSHELDDADHSARGEGGGLRAMQRKVAKVGFKESVEMPGASEYLHNNDGEALSEDQLDRLLIQAKKTRGFDK